MGTTAIELGVSLSFALLLGIPTFGVLYVIGYLAYLTFFYWYFGGSIGHLVLGARVVNHRNGGPLSLGQAIGRSVVTILDWFGILFLINSAMVLIRADRRHLYDLMAGTVVVYDRRASGDRWTRIAPR